MRIKKKKRDIRQGKRTSGRGRKGGDNTREFPCLSQRIKSVLLVQQQHPLCYYFHKDNLTKDAEKAGEERGLRPVWFKSCLSEVHIQRRETAQSSLPQHTFLEPKKPNKNPPCSHTETFIITLYKKSSAVRSTSCSGWGHATYFRPSMSCDGSTHLTLLFSSAGGQKSLPYMKAVVNLTTLMGSAPCIHLSWVTSLFMNYFSNKVSYVGIILHHITTGQ